MPFLEMSRPVWLIIFTLFSVLAGCSTGGDPTAPGDLNPTGNAEVKQGVLYNIEGVQYSSGGESGITGSGGSLSYEVGSTIQFFVGDILLGEAPAQAIVSIADLVQGARDDTDATVRNLYRFLLNLDIEDNSLNEIRITQSIRDNAIGKSVDFSRTDVDFEVSEAATINEILNRAGVSLVSVKKTITGLRQNLRGLYAGFYEGTFSDGVEGSWTVTLDTDGNIRGGASTNSGTIIYTFDLGQLKADGSVEMITRFDTGIRFFANSIDRYGSINGFWEKFPSGDTGNFSGNKSSPAINDGLLTTNDNLLGGILVYNTVAPNFANFEDTSINLKAPNVAENGAVVPVSITFPSNTGSLWLFVENNDQKIVSRADFLVSGDNGLFSIRIQMLQGSDVIAVFQNSDGSLIAAKKFVDVTAGARPGVLVCSPGCVPQSLTDTEVRSRSTNNNLKLLLSYKNYVSDYVDIISIRAEGVLVANIYLGPYLSSNPFVSLNHPVHTDHIVGGHTYSIGYGIKPSNSDTYYVGELFI